MKAKRLLLFAAIMTLCGVVMHAAYPTHVSVTTQNGNKVTVTAVAENIIKITNCAPGETTRLSRASVLNESSDGKWLNPDGKGTQVNVCGLSVMLESNGRVTIDGGAGKKVVDNGERSRDAKGRRQLSLSLNGKGSLYGAGERGHKLNLRGDTLVMYNRQNYGYTGSDPRINQMNITMPLFLSTDGYAIVFDDYAAALMVLGETVTYATESKTPVSWYYVNGAKSLADVTTSLTALTGRQELPPTWTMGYVTSKYGYHNQSETEGVVDTLKNAGYPVDGLVLDLYWYGVEQDMGRLDWDRTKWPDPAGMLSRLKERGVNVVTISQPYVLRNGKGLDNYNTLAPKGLFVADSTGTAPQEVKIWVGEGGMWDMSNADTRRWLSDRYRMLTDMGIGGWWGDLGEPEMHPETALHANGQTAREYHNQYGNDWSEIIFDLYKKQYPQTRLISMMRGGTTGLQRYDVFPWSTDVSRSWGGLEPQIRIMINSGLSGLGYMGHDVGGFAVDNDPRRQSDAELYVRWLQLGVFSPMLRTHAQAMAEPFKYPEYEGIILPLVLERYRWLPYNYTLAYENATKGWPLVRPLNFHSTNAAENYDSISDEYLWGRDVLIAPVMTQGAVSRSIVFPQGASWVDMSNTARIYAGGSTEANYAAPLNVLPKFARAGAFIPMADYDMGSTLDYNHSKYTINYYPAAGAVSTYTMFEDDMTTPSSASGNKGRLITMQGDASGNSAAVRITADGSYNGADTQKIITFVFNCQTTKPSSVLINGKKSRFIYDEENHTVALTFKWKVEKPTTITLKK
jgi:alpha-glucosidase (family GH31 glycosyl hydrolase)